MALEFFVEMRKIRRRLATFVEAPRSRSEQRLFQLPIIPAFGQRPSHPCRLGVFQILVNRSVSDRAATGDLPLPQSQLVSESQYFFELSHGQPFRGQCWFPPLTSGTLMPALLSSVLRPAPSRTVQGLWKSFRNDPGQGSGHRRKVTGLRSESVTGFIPESCPASFRNGARNDFGIVPGLPRNPPKGAASVGYRHFDCASVYGNEDRIGVAIREIIKGEVQREELWVTSKLWNDKHGESDVIASCRQSLEDLQLDHLNMLPCSLAISELSPTPLRCDLAESRCGALHPRELHEDLAPDGEVGGLGAGAAHRYVKHDDSEAQARAPGRAHQAGGERNGASPAFSAARVV